MHPGYRRLCHATYCTRPLTVGLYTVPVQFSERQTDGARPVPQSRSRATDRKVSIDAEI